jgi:phosphatidylcholine synthase
VQALLETRLIRVDNTPRQGKPAAEPAAEPAATARAAAWAVHALTAAGLALAAFATVMIVRGDDAALRAALIALLLAMVIDSVDGTLARRWNVQAVLPAINGRTLDDIVDFHTYTSVPLFLIWRTEALPACWGWILLAPLMASAYGFARTHAKTDDGYFLGFPSYWNVVAFYIFYLRPAPWLSAGVVLLLAALTLPPTRYLYPSAGGRLNLATAVAGAVWAVLLVLIIGGAFADQRSWTLLSLAFPAWYMGASWAVSARQ